MYLKKQHEDAPIKLNLVVVSGAVAITMICSVVLWATPAFAITVSIDLNDGSFVPEGTRERFMATIPIGPERGFGSVELSIEFRDSVTGDPQFLRIVDSDPEGDREIIRTVVSGPETPQPVEFIPIDFSGELIGGDSGIINTPFANFSLHSFPTNEGVGESADVTQSIGTFSGLRSLFTYTDLTAVSPFTIDTLEFHAISDDTRIVIPETVVTGNNVFTSAGGGAKNVGGVDFLISSTGGTLTADYVTGSDAYLEALGADAPVFFFPGFPAQVWDIRFDGTLTGPVEFTVGYDDTLLTVPEAELEMYHWDSARRDWEKLIKISQNEMANTLTVLTNSFSPFVLGVPRQANVVPEGSTFGLSLIGMSMVMCFGRYRERR